MISIDLNSQRDEYCIIDTGKLPLRFTEFTNYSSLICYILIYKLFIIDIYIYFILYFQNDDSDKDRLSTAQLKQEIGNNSKTYLHIFDDNILEL
jgi:hypothetical protein